jgi:hypothetical protein
MWIMVSGPYTAEGADEEMERFRSSGRPVYFDIAEIPASSRQVGAA